MNHKERLEQLGLEKQKLIAGLNEIEGAMKYAIQCLQSEASSAKSQPLNTEASTPQEEAVPSE